MNRKLLIKVLKLLEETYPQLYHAGKLTRILGVSLNGEFSKIIRYLEESEKIEVRRIGQDPSQNERERYYPNDEIKIKPDGINFLEEIKLLESREKIVQQQTNFTKILALATIILGVAALLNLFNIKIPINELFGITFSQILIAMITGLSLVILFLAFFLLFPEMKNLIHKNKV